MFFSVKFDDKLKLTRELIVENAYEVVKKRSIEAVGEKFKKVYEEAYAIKMNKEKNKRG